MRKHKFYYLVEYNMSLSNFFGFYSSPEKIVEDLYKTYKCKFYYSKKYNGYDYKNNHYSTYLSNNEMINIIPNISVGEHILVSMIFEDKSFSDLKITKCKLNLLTCQS